MVVITGAVDIKGGDGGKGKMADDGCANTCTDDGCDCACTTVCGGCGATAGAGGSGDGLITVAAAGVGDLTGECIGGNGDVVAGAGGEDTVAGVARGNCNGGTATGGGDGASNTCLSASDDPLLGCTGSGDGDAPRDRIAAIKAPATVKALAGKARVTSSEPSADKGKLRFG